MALSGPSACVPTCVSALLLHVIFVPVEIASAQCPSPTAVGVGARYLEVTPPPAHPDPVAIYVSQTPSNPWCSKYVNTLGRLVDEPVFLTPAEWGTVYVRDAEIVPGASYNVQTDCGSLGSPDLSAMAGATTDIWGDVVGADNSQPPDGVVNFNDISAVVDKFKGLPGAPPMPQADLAPASPDYVADFNDIGGCVDAFKGLVYPDDCNEDGVLDACDIAAGWSSDCQPNDIPDECETDCQPNGVPDDCDIALGTSEDCQLNGVPDECDPDCDGDGIPDDCDTWDDADGDGIHDCWDLCNNNPPDRACICPELCTCYFPGSGIYIPNYPRWSCLLNGGIPDCTEYICRDGCLVGDFDFDGDVDYGDEGQFQLCFSGPGVPHPTGCQQGDFEPDGDVDCDDWENFKIVWTEPTDPLPPYPEWGCEP